MTQFENIKIAIFDFDDTLALHKDKDYIKHRKENGNAYWINAYKNPDIFYEEMEPCIAPDAMKTLVSDCRKNDIKMYCVSAMRFSLHLKAKESFVNKHYGSDVEMFSASSQQRKVDVVDVISEIHQCKYENILFVDDMEENVISMKKVGIRAITPNEVPQIKLIGRKKDE